MSQFKLTSWQWRRLRRQLRETQDVHLCRRTLAILEFERGRSALDIAQMLGVTRQTVYNWIETYSIICHPSTLADEAGRGRQTILNDDDEHVLHALLKASPQDSGYPHTIWTVPLLSHALQRITGCRVSDDSMRRVLHRLHYLWKRPRYVLDPDPELSGKKRRIRLQIKQLRPRSVLLAQDETDLLHFPPLRASWSLRGQRQEVRICGRNARRVIFGAMNLLTGTRLFMARHRQQAVDFQTYLQMVHDRYRGWHVAMLLDEDSSHTAKGSVHLAESKEIELIWLPKRVPELHPMETLWGQGKDIVCANKQYKNIDEQVTRFLSQLQQISNHDALRTNGVLSPDFWLKVALSEFSHK